MAPFPSPSPSKAAVAVVDDSAEDGLTIDQADPRAGPLLMTVPEAARVRNIGRRQAWELVWRNQVPVVRLGRSVRIARTALERFVLDRSRPYGG